jgi:hypothetical protein
MSQKHSSEVAVIGTDIGKNSFHLVGQDRRGALVLRQKWSRGQVEARLANLSACMIGMEACVGAHHLSRKLRGLGHDARLMPAKYVRPQHVRCGGSFRRKRPWPTCCRHGWTCVEMRRAGVQLTAKIRVATTFRTCQTAEWWSFMALRSTTGRIGEQLKRPAGAARPTDQSTIRAAWEDRARGLM